MRRGRRLGALIVVMMSSAVAQQPDSRAEQIERQRAATSATPIISDTDAVERAIKWSNDHGILTIFSKGWKGVAPTIGGMVNGSGFATGLQFLRQGDFVLRSSARISTRQYLLFDAEAGLPQLLSDHAYLDIYLRYRNNPQTPYYGPGAHSFKTGRSNYRMEDVSGDFSAGLKPHRRIRLGVTGGYLQANVGPGSSLDIISSERIYTPRQTPGIDIQSDFLRGGVVADADFRDNPYGPRAGGHYYGRFDYYDDRSIERFSFRRLTAEVQQFVPLFNKKRVLAARAKTTLSYPGPRQQVPFYLQTTLGGADDLRGFRPYRFYDDNSLILNAEWRWEILSGVEGALFVDAGKVFSQPAGLNFSRLEKSYGGGLRFRTPATGAMVMRMDIAASREGIQFWFVFNDVFAAPQIRTGRELSPPTGRLP